MQTADKQNLQTLSEQVISAFESFAQQIDDLSATATDSHTRLEREILRIRRDREELDILHSLETGSHSILRSPDTIELENLERELSVEFLSYRQLSQNLTDFRSAISTVTNRLAESESSGLKSGLDEINIKMAEIRAREDERRRFASDVHDGPAQAFANAVIGLEFVQRALTSDTANQNQDAINEIERIKAAMREGLTEIRRFIFDNRPTMLKDRGLVATIEHYISSYQSIFPTRIILEIDNRLIAIGSDQELTSFRVIQESIQNANKHARATVIRVGIRKHLNRLLVSISDDGRGFSPERVRTHALGGSGLRGMEERVELNGGTFNIVSSPGDGTTVNASFPLLDS